MTTYQTPIVIGIFQDEVQAKNAVDTLRNAGFRYDQVGVAINASTNATSNLQTDLVNLGVSEEQAHYYDEAYKSGKIVVSIRPDGRDSEVQDILTSNGAYNYEQREAAATTPSASTTTETDAADTSAQPQDAVQAEPADAQDEAASTTSNQETAE
ncbi:hypothetical protein [Dictyobacter formicarum]|uniref:General stress protein 17M-like domain-containing protein n=1 Tax=Dictyobacter formicarum TaxID=2778368 RepID=A0ABQ3VLE3_9CHLR|nr:hypothetical protein [Dictyobacter formicarum]GHO86509.1 hypothetical protein KSZ_45150 [Dictyobacter formicarum]